MERRVRIVVTLALVTGLAALMFISIEPEIDLTVDQLMANPAEYEGEKLRLHGTVASIDLENRTLTLSGENATINIDFETASLPNGADENKTISVRGLVVSEAGGWSVHAEEIKVGCPSKYEAAD